MAYYYNKVPFFMRWMYSKATWKIKTSDKILYLTFDDGPTENITNFILDELNKFNAKATFFCLGYNTKNNPRIVEEIIENGHTIGNHSFSHPNGFKSKIKSYIDDVKKAEEVIDSNMFRPPFGKMKLKQYNHLKKKFRIILWDVMAGDFDENISGEQCFKNVETNISKGSIVVFHDSEQAFPRLKIALPKVLKHYSELGYRFESL